MAITFKSASKLVKSASMTDAASHDFENLMSAYDNSMIAIEDRRPATDKLLFGKLVKSQKFIVSNFGKENASPFGKFIRESTQAYKLDVALAEWHTVEELMILSDSKTRNRVTSHIAYVENVVKAVKQTNGRLIRFVA